MTEYQKYQLQWMIDHNHSLEELFERMDEIVDEIYHRSDRPLPTDAMEDFEEIGFKGSEIWSSEDEWEMNDKNMDECEGCKSIINELIEKQIDENLNRKYRNKQNDFDEIVNQCLNNRTLQSNDSELSNTKNKKYETIYEMILDKLGTSEGEKFNIILKDGTPFKYNPYHFEDGYLIDSSDDVAYGVFAELIIGEATIEKLPWRPKDKETIWVLDADGKAWMTTYNKKSGSSNALVKLEWAFPTKEEAEANRERILKEMKEIIKNKE